MATYQSRPAVAQPYHAAAIPSNGAPAGTFAPGTKVQIGSHRVVVEKYLSEGGFAHVYVVRLPGPDAGTAVLKRVAVPDKDALANMRNEVETMKRLRGHKHIVMYIDSHASQLKGGGYEVFLLMEYCAGGGLIDFMNTRLKNRLTEPEIVDIFGDAAEGVAYMHYLKPPLLHRDLKVENILISNTSDGRQRFKLCDFGSAAPPRPAAKSASEGRLIEEDVQRHTTLQYRSPEMVDVYRHKPIDEKSDIWALGVLLYKLCYYTTPFEEQGQMAILRASFKYPAYPQFSDHLKKLIAMMLMEEPSDRPNIYQVIKKVSNMRGKECPIKDIYAGRTQSEARDTQKLPPREPNVKSPPMVGAKIEAPEEEKQYIPEVTPMRRGRPTAPTASNASARPSPSPGKTGGDPFAALDSKNYDDRVKAVDQLSQKFPALDEFSLLSNKGSKFEFEGDSEKPPAKPHRPTTVGQRMTDVLADEAFVKPSPTQAAASRSRSDAPPRTASLAKVTTESVQARPSPAQRIEQPQPQRATMVSTGTMTSRPSSPKEQLPRQPPKPSLEVWKVPNRDESPRLSSLARFDAISAKRPQLRDFSRSPQPDVPQSPASSRPSLEGTRPISIDLTGDLHRSHSTHGAPEHPRHRHGSGLFRRGSSHKEAKRRSGLFSSEPHGSSSPTVIEDTNIASDMDYLRVVEAENDAAAKSHHRRSSSTLKQLKHASLPAVGGSVKQKFAGKFGDTFKRFENNRQTPPRSENLIDVSSSTTTPLASQAISDEEIEDDDPTVRPPSRPSGLNADVLDDRIDETEDAPPEMRRELERRQLEAEERRVEEAAAAYRARVATGEATSGGPDKPSSRANAIQNRVRNLLDESGRESPVKKTAEGYGRYTDDTKVRDMSMPEKQLRAETSGLPKPRSDIHKSNTISTSSPSHRPNPNFTRQPNTQKPLPPKPSVAPKPVALRTGGSFTNAPAKPLSSSKPITTASGNPIDTSQPIQKGQAPNLMDDSPGMSGPPQGDGAVNLLDDSPDWEASFAKRYPRLSLELVEAEIGGNDGVVRESSAPEVRPAARRVREV